MPRTRSGKIVGKTIGVPSRSAAAAKRQRKDLEQPLSTMLVEEELNQFSAKHRQVEEELNHFSAKHKTVGVYTRRCTRTKRDKLVESFEKCRKQPEVEGKSDMELWTEVVGGPRRGKIFGLGGRSIKLVDEGATSSFSKTGTYMSTATSSTPSIPIYTAEEADRLLAEDRKLQERKMIEALARIEAKHLADLDSVKRRNEKRDAEHSLLIKDLYVKTGYEPPASLAAINSGEVEGAQGGALQIWPTKKELAEP